MDGKDVQIAFFSACDQPKIREKKVRLPFDVHFRQITLLLSCMRSKRILKSEIVIGFNDVCVNFRETKGSSKAK